MADAETPLDALEAVVLDTETSGLDVTRERVIQIGAVRVLGRTVEPAALIDELVNPERPIPRRATAIHGITDAVVADAPKYVELAPEIEHLLDGRVPIGHNVAFDLAILNRESLMAGRPWKLPQTLESLLIATALDILRRRSDLDVLAERMRVPVQGRHSARGDARLTAEIYVRQLEELDRKGIDTFDAFVARRARRLLNEQRAHGWPTPIQSDREMR